MINVHFSAFSTSLLNKSTCNKHFQTEGFLQGVKLNLQSPVSPVMWVLEVNAHIKHLKLYSNFSSLHSARLHLKLHATCLYLTRNKFLTMLRNRYWAYWKGILIPTLGCFLTFHWKCAWVEAPKFLANISFGLGKVFFTWSGGWFGTFQISFHVCWMESGVPRSLLWLPLTWLDEEFFLIHDLAIVSPHTAQVTL